MSIIFTLLMKFLILPFLVIIVPIVAFCLWVASMDENHNEDLPTEKGGEYGDGE